MQNNIDKVAVLLATHNGEQHIRQQLTSIENQEKVDLSLFISDDQSSDSTRSVLNENVISKISVTVLPLTKSGGASANFFRLFRLADFSNVNYVALSDQDDIWENNKLSTALQKMKEEHADAYSSNVVAFWESGEKRLINKSQPQQRWDFLFESAGPGCTFVLTKKLALEIKAFVIEHEKTVGLIDLHDWFIYAFARSHGYKWFIDKESFMLYRQHHVNVMGANIGLKAKLKRLEKLIDGWYTNQIFTLADLLGMDNRFPILQLKRLNIVDRIILLINIRKFRRNFWDSIALILLLILPKK